MILDKFKLTDKVAIVTGAGRGVGKGIALAFAEAEANVVCASWKLEEEETTATEIRARGRKALALCVDARNEEQLEEMVKKTLDVFGRVDVLVNNAGGTFFSSLLEISQKGFEAVLRENLVSCFLCSKAVAKVMVKQNSGNIINISSRASQHGTKNVGPYGAAKAGMNNLTETLAWELADHNIRVNCLSLGPVLTENNRDIYFKDPEKILSGLLIKRFGLPEDVGTFCVFLASEASSWITGRVYEIDGGLRSTAEL